jgi:hypothetical protein
MIAPLARTKPGPFFNIMYNFPCREVIGLELLLWTIYCGLNLEVKLSVAELVNQILLAAKLTPSSTTPTATHS